MPDRRGKRGEVAAIFAMITTNPTRSIGELGLGTTLSTRPPSCSQARAACSSSLVSGCPRGMRSWPPIARSGSPSSATTASGPSALAVATWKDSRAGPRPKSSSLAWTTLTLVRRSLAAVASTQSSRRRCASIMVKDVARCATANGSPGNPAPDPRSAQRSSGSGRRIAARPKASSRCRSQSRSCSRGPRKPRWTASA